MKTHWEKTQEKAPTASAGAKLMLCEIAEHAHLKKLKCFPIRALLLLEDSIKKRAEYIIQNAVTA